MCNNSVKFTPVIILIIIGASVGASVCTYVIAGTRSVVSVRMKWENGTSVQCDAIATMSGRIIRIEARMCVQRRGDTCGSAACRHQQPTLITPAAAADTGASNFGTLCTVVILILLKFA